MFVTQLKSFFTVARLGSVTQAAKQLGLSQPTVTTQIKALEAHYGVALFRRQGGRLSLSDEGAQLLPQVDRLLQQEIQVEFALRESGELPRGHLRLGATAPYYVLDIVQRVRARHPQVSVSLGAGNSRQMVDALLAYQVDLATSSHLETDPRLHRVTLGADPLVLLLHREHPLAARPTLQLADLAACDLILRERGSTTRQITEDALARAGVQVRGVMEIASREAIREAVIRRMGVSVFARHEVSSHPDLVSRPLADELPSLVEYLYCLQERRESRLIAAFLAECRPATGPRG
ncbi:LysR substrate-binding domain-containing protein [Curvibacter sp. RS43]|uniref:LysR substrate-binding domain-containing protein n=1 Tax=Curvibacter microcysteis TaxID=3026419 RepID=UPI002362C699|nr:LysR substrate-binding domain-containing protein [Curvibacter sp. RS43]MDD0811379.1 LysR substrate-binding domain-containing protein [Curvibacter sp. RS43]